MIPRIKIFRKIVKLNIKKKTNTKSQISIQFFLSLNSYKDGVSIAGIRKTSFSCIYSLNWYLQIEVLLEKKNGICWNQEFNSLYSFDSCVWLYYTNKLRLFICEFHKIEKYEFIVDLLGCWIICSTKFWKALHHPSLYLLV